MIRDLGSHNGVRVNGRPVLESRLLPDDELAIGPLIYRVLARPDPREAAGQAGTQRPTPSAVPAGDIQASPAVNDSEEIGLVPIDSF